MSESLRLFRNPIIVLDTETTGIIGKHPWAECVELGAVCLDVYGREVGRFGSLVQPEVLDERAAPALEINHITPGMLLDAPDRATVLGEWEAWRAKMPAKYVTAFNVPFDAAILEKLGVPGLKWAPCVMEAAAESMRSEGVWIRGPRVKLSSAAEHFGVTVEGEPHRAETDARTAARVLCGLRAREVLRQSFA